jgi:hypothetical protein
MGLNAQPVNDSCTIFEETSDTVDIMPYGIKTEFSLNADSNISALTINIRGYNGIKVWNPFLTILSVL